MASEADSIEVDSGYKSVAASWFADIDPEDKKKPKKRSKDNHLDQPVKKKKPKLSGEDESNDVDKHRNDHVTEICVPLLLTQPTLQTEQPSPTLTTFLDEKLSKKLKKSKWKAQQKLKDQQSREEKAERLDDSEDSKVNEISKLRKAPGPGATVAHTEESLRGRLAEPTLSQSARKRLRKMLNKLTQDKDQGSLTKSESSLKAYSKMNLSKVDKNYGNIHVKDELKSKSENKYDGSNEKQKKMKDDNDNHDIKKNLNGEHGDSPPVKRKKTKKRSRQKNIKKDNRPDHLKPARFRTKVTEDDKGSS